MLRLLSLSASFFLLLLFTACQQTATENTSSLRGALDLFEGTDTLSISGSLPQQETIFDYSGIIDRDTLKAILTYSSTSYFIYKGQPMGYEYELIHRLAEDLGVHLEPVLAKDMDEMFNMLLRGEGDIIAHGLTITNSRKKIVDFTLPHNQTQQVLVQKKPDNWRKMKLHEIENMMIRSPLDLIHQTVSVRGGSAYYDRLINLMDEIGGEINIELVPGYHTTDELIGMVADGELELTVADQNIALINQTYYDLIDIETSMSLIQQLAWAVRKSSPDLRRVINEWIAQSQQSVDYHVIYNKYFKNKREFRSRMASEYFTLTGGQLSPFDEQIIMHAEELGWDWRLLASLIYQESRFEVESESWVGASGLMQVMPATARGLGYTRLDIPEENLKAGTAYLKQLQGIWEHIPDSTERIKFILASYNAGPGHVQDAQRLAEKLGKDPLIWDGNTADCILLKSKPDYFNDPVVKYGYCRGNEPYHYVQDILKRYVEYEQLVI
ncbi:MAG: transporter substrate-binding domain-containing protein [Bacteroidota bacterium]